MKPVKACGSLEEIRAEIDLIDSALLSLLAERAAYVRQAAPFKKDSDAVRAPARVEQVIARIRSQAADKNVPPAVAESVWRAMIAAFIAEELQEHQRISADS